MPVSRKACRPETMQHISMYVEFCRDTPVAKLQSVVRSTTLPLVCLYRTRRTSRYVALFIVCTCFARDRHSSQYFSICVAFYNKMSVAKLQSVVRSTALPLVTCCRTRNPSSSSASRQRLGLKITRWDGYDATFPDRTEFREPGQKTARFSSRTVLHRVPNP